jgi:WD40 repeat protein
MEGVAAAVDAVDYSLPLEGAGETDFDSYLISPNGEKILGTFSNSRTGSTKLTLWDARTGKRTSDAKRPGSLGMSSFSRDGKRLALVFFGTPRNDLLIWDLTGPQVRPVGTLCGPSGNDGFTITVALDSDGSHIIIGESKGSGHSHVTICEIATGRKEVVTSLQVVNDAAFTPEDEPALYGRVAAYGPDNLPPVVYFPRTGQKVAVKLSSDPNTAKFSGFGDDGSIIIIARTYNEAAQDRVYVQSTNGDVRRLAGYRGAVNAAAFVAGEGLVVTVSGRKARVADVRRSRNFAALRAHARSLDLVAFSPDDRTILTVGDDGKARLWDAQTGSLLHTLAVTDEVLYEGQPPYNRHKYAAFQPDGTRLVTVNEKGDIQTWDVSTGRPGCSVPGPGPDNKDYPSNVSFLAGGGYLLTAYYRSTTKSVFINFLDARTCRLVRSLDFDEQISFVSVSPDGTAMITGTYPDPAKFDNPDLKLWSLRGLDLRSGGPIRLSTPSVIRLPGPLRGFSFDGTRMVTVTEDGAGQMLVSGGNLPVRLKQWPRDTVGQGYFILSANGARAAGITQSKAWVWDTRSGELLLSFEWDLYLAPGTVSLSSDGSKLIIAGKDNTVRIYPTSREGFLRAARRLLGR